MRILLVEDDKNLAEVVTGFLGKHDFLIDVCADGELAWDMIGLLDYDLILLDVMLPKLDGIALCRRLREHDRLLPILLITARDSVADKLVGLDSGADDYLVKPFDLQELLSRVRVLFRRFADRPMATLTLGDIRLEPERRALTRNGRVVPFTRREYLLIELLFRYPKRIFSRGDIVDRLWPMENLPTEDTVKSHIRRIRHKLAEIDAGDLIETLYGHGYRIDPMFADLARCAPEGRPVERKVSSSREELNAALVEVWQNIRSGVFEQVAILEKASESDRLNPREWESVVETAHKLAGTIGSCGFEAASHIARAIEILLQDRAPRLEIERSLPALVRVLRTQLEEQPRPLEGSAVTGSSRSIG
jgi:DNA-binding response OmpR family regulator/HPt (histidine-containing phosphotransfer) domain-containing protein